jgi:hypothetical protein
MLNRIISYRIIYPPAKRTAKKKGKNYNKREIHSSYDMLKSIRDGIDISEIVDKVGVVVC